MPTDLPYEAFPKIPRLNRNVIVTEKIDGTNATVYVGEDGAVRAGSRNRWITPDDDNYGFARYVADNADTFRQLGPGWHRGEWWGRGIQRGYGLDERRFSLFNAGRWNADNVPEGLYVVPVLYVGRLSAVSFALELLRVHGSQAAPGYARPEGVVVYHTASGQMFKAMCEGDDIAKGAAA